MKLPNPFRERLRPGYQSTPKSAERHRWVNLLGFLAALGAATIAANAVQEAKQPADVNRLIMDVAALEVVATSLGVIIVSGLRDGQQIRLELGDLNNQTLAQINEPMGHNGSHPSGAELATPDEL